MKKLLNTSFIYAILGMIGGVFYREFTKFNGFEGRTSLGFIHLHLFVLGMLFFLLMVLFEKQFSITQHKNFGKFFILYNLGMGITIGTFVWRGIVQVLATPISKGMSASISGIAGIGHMILGLGIIVLFLILKKQIVE